uniref:DegT/DnrJ/EryC1/StrS family aminotransferase n=1 Tax=Trichocoleus desertorum TaxID=1481672 RepID=UPI0025B2EF8E|nr:DegT/DnrJ/EryC1/StrS family aminotransferase [Trichocoleus desertorum]
MNKVPLLDLTRQFQTISEKVNAAVLQVLGSGGYIGGPAVSGFEQQFAAYTGTSECVACNSGTDALFLALRALEIGPGDEVIAPPFTFFATAEVISAVGATPVFVDIDANTFNLDLNLIEAAITEKTRAIIPVHLFGQPVDMTRLMAIAEAHHLAVIEDCAQATGAEWVGKKVGSIGHVGCFSFYPTKNLGAAGDGGAITTNDPAIAAKIRMLKEHGSQTRYYHDAIGMNSRLDAVQAVVLQIKLRFLDEWNAQRRQVAERYQQLLSHIPYIIPPQEISGGQSVWNQYTIRLASTPDAPQHGTEPGALRDWVRQELQSRGVGSIVYYPLPLHLQSIYQGLGYQLGQLPVSEQMSHEVLSLPMFPELSVAEQDQVIYSLKDCLTAVECRSWSGKLK